MKKKAFLSLPIFALTSSFLVSCSTGDSKIRITYGSPIYTEILELTYSDFTQKMTNGENMIVATYNSELSPSCGCWNNFKNILNVYVDAKDTVVYKMDRLEIPRRNPYDLTLPSDSAPTFFITSRGQVEKEYVYNTTSANAKIFEGYREFKEHMDSLVKKPQLMIINEEYLNNAVFTEKEDGFIIYHGRSGCPDCNYCTPNFLEPYVRDNDLKHKVYVMDIEYLRGTDGYQEYKDKYQLSSKNNTTYGFGDGVVPTFQVWKNGVLKDMCVYFNDSYKLEDGKYTITDSYYTTERVKNLAYTDTVLLGHIIPDDEMEERHWGEYTYMSWKQEAMAKIHNQLLGSFLDMYAK